MEINKYRIKGVTLGGYKVNHVFEDKTPQKALGRCKVVFGNLKKGYQIVKEEKIPPSSINIKLPFSNKLSALDMEILSLGQAIRYNRASNKDFHRLMELLEPILTKAIHMYWQDVIIVTQCELKYELVSHIAQEFLPKYCPSKGRLLPFLKQKVNSRVIKKWIREKYCNADNANKRIPKSEKQKEYLQLINGNYEQEDYERKLLHLKAIAQKIEYHHLSLAQRKVFFTYIADLGLHNTILKSRQLQVFNAYYFKDLKENEIAIEFNVTQQTINTTKTRAEKNIFRNLGLP